MKKTLLYMLWLLSFAFFLILVINYANNEKLIKKYNSGIYEQNKLTWMGFTEPYIAHYNRAEIFYQKRDYELAIAEYEKALEGFLIPKSRVCDIRVNLVLCNLNLVDFVYDEYSNDDINLLINTLRDAEKPILEDGCANEDRSSGHDPEAQQLYNDIETYIDYLAYLKKSVNFCGYKSFVDEKGSVKIKDEQFSFLLNETDATYNNLKGTPDMAFCNASGFFVFNEIVFDEPGTYYYTISEVPGMEKGILYDDTVYNVSVKVEENADNGTLDVWVDYNADNPKITEILFTNIKLPPDPESGGGGGSGDGDGDGGGGSSGDDPSGGSGDGEDPDGSGGDTTPETGGGTPPTDPLEEQFWDLINSGNNQHNNDLQGDANHGGYYIGDFW